MTSTANIAHVRILSVNDLHGQLTDSSAKVGDVPIGGAATLAAYVQRERAGNPNGTVFLSGGDNFGASEPESQLLAHESTMAVLGQMGVDLTTIGNHEFDRGYAEAMRLIFGNTAFADAKLGQGLVPASTAQQRARKRQTPTQAALGATLAQRAATAARLAAAGQWPGSPFPWVCANLVDATTKQPFLPPFVVKVVDGVKVAFIGTSTQHLKEVVLKEGVKNVEVQDPATAVNRYVPMLQRAGVKTIVAVVHDGGDADPKDPTKLTGDIVDLTDKLDPEVDAVVSAHSHKEYATTLNGKQVVQAGSYGKALGEIDLQVDRATGQVVSGMSRIIRNDERGIRPDPTVAALVASFHRAVAPKTEKVVGNITAPVTREKSPAGESALGDVIADAQRALAKADIAVMNPGGIRQDLTNAGKVTWGALFGVQPFANPVMKLELSGADVKTMLEQQFPESGNGRVLQISGMTVHVDMTKPAGQRIASVTMADGTPLDPAKTYTVAANGFLADGGDGFVALKQAKKRTNVGIDLDALVAWFQSGAQVPTAPAGRIVLDAGTIPG